MTTTPPRLTPEVAQAAQLEEEYGHYSMRFEWDPEDRIYVVSVPELPGCRTHGATYEEAATKGRDAIASWVAAARHWGTPIPPPRRWAPQRRQRADRQGINGLASGVKARSPRQPLHHELLGARRVDRERAQAP